MTHDEARALIARLYGPIAPDLDIDEIDPDSDFREEAEIDSMDFLNFLLALKNETGYDVPQQDYDCFSTLNGAAAYLSANLGRPGGIQSR